MQQLQRVVIRGFRSLREVDFELGPLTVMVGANGVGKSNVASFFDLLSYLFSGELQLYVGRKGGAGSILHYGPKATPALSAELRFSAGESYEVRLEFAQPDRLVFSHEALVATRSGTQHNVAFKPNRSGGLLESGTLALHRDSSATEPVSVGLEIISKLKSLQAYHFHDTSPTSPIRAGQDLQRNRYLLANGGNLAAFLHMLRSSYPQHYARILSTVQLAVPYLADLVLEPDALSARTIYLRWRDRSGEYEYGPHQWSDGSLRMLALVTALLQPEEFLPRVLVIDEPELGLHPRGISVLAELLRYASTKTQVLVSTQSPRLVAAFEPGEVLVAERREDAAGRGETLLRRLEAEALASWLEEYDLGQLFEMNVTGGGPA
ncbi:MAG: AAA family ATPase [Planctomycetes bacterium]|nr:AAA family ATPase [Planctomycetota bacterium]